ncbi:hypothetical protein HK101_001789 [Irineochytrium annulatum]|nr:hypothetical protein HK101_001789 [Irineochytrium annulatum]
MSSPSPSPFRIATTPVLLDMDLTTPAAGLSAVFVGVSSVINTLEAMTLDRSRATRMAARIQGIALDLNAVALAYPTITAAPAPSSDAYADITLPRRRTSPSGSPTTAASTLLINKRSSFIGAIADYVYSPPASPSTATPTVTPREPPASQVAAAPASPSSSSGIFVSTVNLARRWRSTPTPTGPAAGTPSSPTVSFFFSGRQSSQHLPVPPPPPSHRRPEAFLHLIERVKGLIRAAVGRDGVAIVVGRERFQRRMEELQTQVRSWAEDVGFGIKNAEEWDRHDFEDQADDQRAYEALLSDLVVAVTGESVLVSPGAGRTRSSFSSFGDGTDDESIDVIKLLRLDSSLLLEAESIITDRLALLDEVDAMDANTAATFGADAVAASADGLATALERRWMEVVLAALRRSNRGTRIERGWMGGDEDAAAAGLPWRVVNPYELEEDGDGLPLAQAAFGESRRAVFDGPPPVAVVSKRLSSAIRDLTAKAKFIEELKAWCTLKNEHVMPLIGASAFMTDRPVLVVPYHKNGDMLTYTRAHPGHSLRLLHETALGMSYLHSCGIVHGSLRASNILVNDSGHGVVADFGFWSHRLEASRHAGGAHVRLGWTRWHAPEILRGGELRCPADVYAFSMTCYELVSGGPPFQGLVTDAGYDDPADSEEEEEIRRRVLFDNVRPSRPGTNGHPHGGYESAANTSAGCPDLLWELLVSCWSQEALLRPEFPAVEARLKTLLRMQSAFRRQSQIKSRSEAFMIHVPLDDLTPALLDSKNSMFSGMSGTPSVSSSSRDGTEEWSEAFSEYGRQGMRRAKSNGSDMVDSAYDRSPRASMISLNLSFTLDGIIGPPHPSTSLRLGIDLPPVTHETDETESNDPSDESEATEYKDSATWPLWLNLVSNAADEPTSAPWLEVAAALRLRLPTLLASSSLKRILDPTDTHKVTYRAFNAILSAAPQPTLDGLTVADTAFVRFCLTPAAPSSDPRSPLLDSSKVREVLAARGVTSDEPASASLSGTQLLHLAAKCVPSLAGDLFDVLLDARVMAANCVDLDGADGKGWTPLHYACKSAAGALPCQACRATDGACDCPVKRLIGAGCQVSIATPRTLWTPLHVAAWGGATVPVTRLIEGGVDAWVADAEGWTAIVHGARYNHGVVVQIMMDAMKNDEAKWPQAKEAALQVARAQGHEEIIAMLEA